MEKVKSNGAAKTNGASPATGKSRKLNTPVNKSEMSEADKLTLKAWKRTYNNREKRVD